MSDKQWEVAYKAWPEKTKIQDGGNPRRHYEVAGFQAGFLAGVAHGRSTQSEALQRLESIVRAHANDYEALSAENLRLRAAIHAALGVDSGYDDAVRVALMRRFLRDAIG